MAATDKTYRSQKVLDIVFAVSCVLMLLSVLWMLAADYSREFKTVQRDFRDVESALNERLMLDQLPSSDEVTAKEKAVGEARKDLEKAKAKVHDDELRLAAEHDLRDADYRTVKADYDSKMSFYDIAVGERDEFDPAKYKAEYEARDRNVEDLKKELDEIRKRLNDARKKVEETEAAIQEKVRGPLAGPEKALSDAEDDLKKTTGAFDRFAKVSVQKNWKIGDAIRALPIIDGFASPTKVSQIVLNDLTIDYGSFKAVPRYDRCTSCHLATDRATFDKANLKRLAGPHDWDNLEHDQAEGMQQLRQHTEDLTALVLRAADQADYLSEDKDAKAAKARVAGLAKTWLDNTKQKLTPGDLARQLADLSKSAEDVLGATVPPGDEEQFQKVREKLGAVRDLAKSGAEEAQKVQKGQDQLQPLLKLRTAKRLLAKRQKMGETLGFDPDELAPEPRTFPLTSGQTTMYAAHPRLDLFVDSNSPHPQEKFGCTICHAGQGSATDFQLAAHSPADARQLKVWEKEHNWHAGHDWDYPMLSSRFVESTCVKCHYEMTDLINRNGKVEAPKLLRGYDLVRENGCFGCHEIAAVKSGRTVGPDLRLEPAPALEYLSPTDQDKAKADPLNPPGAFRKVGPSLRRLAEKTNEQWTRRWIQSPRGFRPDTKMPHFYGLSNNSPDVLPEHQKDFPAAEIHSIAHYLFAESNGYLKADDAARHGLETRLKELQAKLKEKIGDERNKTEGRESLDDKDRKDLIDLTRRLDELALISAPADARLVNEKIARHRQTQDRLLELYRKLQDANKKGEAGLDEADVTELTQDLKELDTRTTELEQAGRATPLTARLIDSQGEIVGKDLPELGDDDHRKNGRRLFTEKGCLACHSHEATTVGEPDHSIPRVTGEANFGPNLSRVAFKIAPLGADGKIDAKARRRWVVQWVMNPNVHHPRTRMPVTHLSVADACDVADWLLSKEVNPSELEGWKDPTGADGPDPKTLVALARVYLAKAPGMTTQEMEKILPEDAAAKDQIDGVSADRLEATAWDADERALQGPIASKDLPGKLEWYIGKKSISRLGCYGCHDVPGFEQAKPIGTALNDWGKKDPERLAFEDAGAFVREHYHIVPAPKTTEEINAAIKELEAKKDSDTATPDEKTKLESLKKLLEKPPMEEHFFDQLEHHQREGFLHLKLAEPRAYDHNRLRAWDDRLRMPQFQFARSRKQEGESDRDYRVRQEREEAEAREAVMTFVLGLTADPISLKYVNSPKPDRLAEVKGRQVIEKFNCAGCHLIQPGVYEFKKTTDGMDLLEKAYENYQRNDGKTDHVFAGHNAWTGSASSSSDRMIVHGTHPRETTDEDIKRPVVRLRLTEGVRFTSNTQTVHDIPAGVEANLLPEEIVAQDPPFGGTFAELLTPYLAKKNSAEFSNGAEGPKLDETGAVLPPPLVREGERVQPKWLYPFLLNPTPVRPQNRMLLRMPRFNMSPEEAQTLVNYFGAVDKLNNPGAGLTYPYLTVDQHDPKFWSDRNREYADRLQGENAMKPEERAAGMLALEIKQAKENQAAAEQAVADAKTDDEKKMKQKEADDLKDAIKKTEERLQKKDFGNLRDQWKSSDAYSADAYRLVASKTLCLNCHSVGKLEIRGPKGPNLELAAERLRPEWTFQWIANPSRMYANPPAMPPPFPRDSLKYQEYFVGESRDQARAARDLLMDLPRLAELPANRATRAAVEGGAK